MLTKELVHLTQKLRVGRESVYFIRNLSISSNGTDISCKWSDSVLPRRVSREQGGAAVICSHPKHENTVSPNLCYEKHHAAEIY